MATSHYKINPKDLKGPDEFVTTVDRIGNYLANNLIRVIIGAAIFIALAAVIFTYAFYRQHQNQVVADRFYDALTALNRKDYKTAEEGFETLAQTGSGKLASLARLYAASAYMSENRPAQALDLLEAYIADSNQRFFKNIALVQLGVAYEDLRDFKKAHDAYVRAVATPGPEKSRANLGVARTLIKLGDKSAAIAAYREYLAENPYSADRGEAIESLAELGVSATDTATSATTQASLPEQTAGAPAAISH
jgi:predicted negative regulator of RcsB-dependent stress response